MAVSLLLVSTLRTPASAAPAAVDPSIGRVEVTLDLPKDKPYVGEMIMLRMRSFVRADVVLDEIRQPPLIDFDVQQLGRDKPIQAMVDGFNVDGIERDIAIFPEQSGRLIIPPFVRHVTIVNASGERVEADFASKPVYVDVQTYGAINPAGAWWLPAKTLTVTDSWVPEADAIERGQFARRTITVEAVGMTADRLPPPPDMRAPGIISFRGPTERKTIVTEDGPIARATYQWDLRPTIGEPAQVPAIRIPWFDTSERRLREAAIPERWVAYIGTLVHPSHETLATTGLFSAGPLAAGFAGFLWMAGVIVFASTSRRPERRGAKVLRALRRAARFNDEPAFRRVLATLARFEPARYARVTTDPRLMPRMAALDGALYGRAGGIVPSLPTLAADIARHWVEPAQDDPHEPDRLASAALPPIDGEIPAPVSRWRRWPLLPRVRSAWIEAVRTKARFHARFHA